MLPLLVLLFATPAVVGWPWQYTLGPRCALPVAVRPVTAIGTRAALRLTIHSHRPSRRRCIGLRAHLTRRQRPQVGQRIMGHPTTHGPQALRIVRVNGTVAGPNDKCAPCHGNRDSCLCGLFITRASSCLVLEH